MIMSDSSLPHLQSMVAQLFLESINGLALSLLPLDTSSSDECHPRRLSLDGWIQPSIVHHNHCRMDERVNVKEIKRASKPWNQNSNTRHPLMHPISQIGMESFQGWMHSLLIKKQGWNLLRYSEWGKKNENRMWMLRKKYKYLSHLNYPHLMWGDGYDFVS